MTDKTFYYNKGAPEMPGKTLVERTTDDIRNHIAAVRDFLDIFSAYIKERGEKHDASKFSPEEFPYLMKMRERVEEKGNDKFNSDDYEKTRKKNQPFLDHHYANNDHHPEHFKNGIMGMNLLQLMEMAIDWFVAAKQRGGKGGGNKVDLNENQDRFKFSDDVKQILQNTLDLCEEIEAQKNNENDQGRGN